VNAAVGWFAASLVLIATVALAFVLWRSRRKPTPACGGVSGVHRAATTQWTKRAGDELTDLNESARCDLVFAVSQFDDERSRSMLVSALEDPSDTVSLAAAHALVRAGHMRDVDAYARSADAERSQELLALLTLID